MNQTEEWWAPCRCPDEAEPRGLAFPWGPWERGRGAGLLSPLPFAPQLVVVVLGEAMGFVPDVLQQAEGERMAAEAKGFVGTGEVDFLFLLGEREDRKSVV